MIMFSMMMMILGIIFLILSLFTSYPLFFNRDLASPFECGFDPYHSSRVPFSLQFFLITVIFLIFDIEITLLLPLPMAQNMNFPSLYFISSTLFIMILLIGTYYEWYKNALNWTS